MMELGKHKVVIVDHGFSEANTGTTQLYVVFSNAHQEEITWYSTMGKRRDGTFSDKGVEFFVKDCRTMGFDPHDHGWDFAKLGDGRVSLVGNQVQIVVEDEEYNGKTNRRVKWINSLTSRKELNPAEKASFFKNLRAACFEHGVTAKKSDIAPPPKMDLDKRQPPPAKREPAPAAAPNPHANGIDYDQLDDIPF